MSVGIVPRLRRATPGDVDALAALMASAGHRLAEQGFGNWLPPYPRERIAADVAEREVWVATLPDEGAAGDAIAGTFTLAPFAVRPYAGIAWTATDPVRYLNRVAVDPAWQGRGLGAWCIARAVALSLDAGARAVRCDVLSANARLRALYERHGFAPRGERSHSGWTFTCYERLLADENA